MNEELIKDLWWKARIGYNNQSCDPEVLAKFAELIVKDVAEFVEYKFDFCGDEMIIAEKIRERYGVEE